MPPSTGLRQRRQPGPAAAEPGARRSLWRRQLEQLAEPGGVRAAGLRHLRHDPAVGPALIDDGAFDGLGSSNAQATGGGSGEAAKSTEEVIPKDRIADHISAEQLNDFKIPEGSGGEALMNRLGTDPGVWYANQDEFLKEFPNEAYRMPDGNVGFTDPGRLSNDAIKFWSKKSGIWQ